MKLQNVLFSLLISTSVISNAMADTSFLQTQVSFDHIYETAKRTDYEQIFNSDFIFLLYPYSKNDKWLIQDIAQACVNYTTVNKEITRDTCKNFVIDIIGIEEADSTIVKTEETNVPTIKDGEFVLTTTTDTTEFKFTINAPGEYTVDCGNNKTATKNSVEYTCEYDNAAKYDITVTGRATDYLNEKPAISFNGNTKLAKITGSLGSVFPTLSDKQPIFEETFAGCTGLTEIPADLFSGINGIAPGIFFGTFTGCTGLTSIPEKLFSTISGAPANSMFAGTFENCTGLTEIPEKLFENIKGEPAENMFAFTFSGCTGLKKIEPGLFSSISGTPADSMFAGTFENCTDLTSIPEKLFEKITGTPAPHMFNSTFSGCTGLTKIEPGLFSSISGTPADFMFAFTFQKCTNLTSIPDNLFSTISGAPADSMFKGTFKDCTKLTETITPDFFGNITSQITQEYLNQENTIEGTGITFLAFGKFVLTTTANTSSFKFKINAPSEYYYIIDCGNGIQLAGDVVDYECEYTDAGQYNITVKGLATDYTDDAAISFENNTKLAKITGSLGSVFPTLSNKQPIFQETFSGCTGLTEIPPDLFSGISGAPATNMFLDTFYGCTGLTSIPADLFSTISGTPAPHMFDGTFFECTGLTSIPAGLFSTISGTPAESMFAYTFKGCTGLTEIKPGLFSTISGAPAKSMFEGTFWDCTGLTSIPDDLFSTISGAHAEDMFDGTFAGCTGLTGTITPKFFGAITPQITQEYLNLEEIFKDASITYQTTSNSAD